MSVLKTKIKIPTKAVYLFMAGNILALVSLIAYLLTWINHLLLALALGLALAATGLKIMEKANENTDNLANHS